jgi:hypothetical protein
VGSIKRREGEICNSKVVARKQPSKQQSTIELTVFVAVPMGEGVGSMVAKVWRLNCLCGCGVRSMISLCLVLRSHA